MEEGAMELDNREEQQQEEQKRNGTVKAVSSSDSDEERREKKKPKIPPPHSDLQEEAEAEAEESKRRPETMDLQCAAADKEEEMEEETLKVAFQSQSDSQEESAKLDNIEDKQQQEEQKRNPTVSCSDSDEVRQEKKKPKILPPPHPYFPYFQEVEDAEESKPRPKTMDLQCASAHGEEEGKMEEETLKMASQSQSDSDVEEDDEARELVAKRERFEKNWIELRLNLEIEDEDEAEAHKKYLKELIDSSERFQKKFIEEQMKPRIEDEDYDIPDDIRKRAARLWKEEDEPSSDEPSSKLEDLGLDPLLVKWMLPSPEEDEYIKNYFKGVKIEVEDDPLEEFYIEAFEKALYASLVMYKGLRRKNMKPCDLPKAPIEELNEWTKRDRPYFFRSRAFNSGVLKFFIDEFGRYGTKYQKLVVYRQSKDGEKYSILQQQEGYHQLSRWEAEVSGQYLQLFIEVYEQMGKEKIVTDKHVKVAAKFIAEKKNLDRLYENMWVLCAQDFMGERAYEIIIDQKLLYCHLKEVFKKNASTSSIDRQTILGQFPLAGDEFYKEAMNVLNNEEESAQLDFEEDLHDAVYYAERRRAPLARYYAAKLETARKIGIIGGGKRS